MPSRTQPRLHTRGAWRDRAGLARRAGAIAVALFLLAACAGSFEDRLAEIHALQDAGQFNESLEPLREPAGREPRSWGSELPARRGAGTDGTALARGVAAREGEFRSQPGDDGGAAARLDLSRPAVARGRRERRHEGARTGSLPHRRAEGARAGAARRQPARGSAAGHDAPARTRTRGPRRADVARDDPRQTRSDRRGRTRARGPREARCKEWRRGHRGTRLSRARQLLRGHPRGRRARRGTVRALHRTGSHRRNRASDGHALLRRTRAPRRCHRALGEGARGSARESADPRFTSEPLRVERQGGRGAHVARGRRRAARHGAGVHASGRLRAPRAGIRTRHSRRSTARSRRRPKPIRIWASSRPTCSST